MPDERVELERVEPREDAPLERAGYPRTVGYSESAYGYGYGDPAGDNRINPREIWRLVRKRKWLILVIAAVATSVATIEAYRTKSLYRASATIEIGKDSTTLVKTADLVVQSEDSDSLKTRMLILKSRPLLESVAVKLELERNPRFLDVNDRKSVVESLQTIGNKFGLGLSLDEPPAESVESNPEPEQRDDADRLKPYVNVLSAHLGVEHIPDTRALVVSFTHTEPRIAEAVANGAARDFIERSFENKTERFTRTSEWLDRTTRELQARMRQAEQALQEYTQQHNIYAGEGKETLTSDKLARLHDQVVRAETDRILKQSLYEEVRQGRVAQLPDAFSDSSSVGLQAKLNELQTMAAQLDVKYGPDNPRVIEVRQQMEAIRAQITGSRSTLELKLAADYERAVRDEKALRGALERAKSEATRENQAAIQYNILRQDVETAKALYTEFLQKTNQANIQVAEQHSNMRMIEPAVLPTSPVGPKRLRAILIGLFLSLVGGVGLAFFLEYLDNTIKTVDDVSRYAQLPALGVIPAIAAPGRSSLRGTRSRRKIGAGSPIPAGAVNGSNQLMALETRSSAAEAYRVLRTSVLLSAAGNPPRTVLVTSAQPGEGKTTTVINTAISLAQLGASVLIIDCDMRKPSVHRVLGVDHVRGLSTYLSRNVEPDGLIHKLQMPNLSLLPCGPIPPNPAELISSERMKGLLKSLASRYDHILIDSPPLINLTDPVILSTLVDGVMLVVHGGKSTREAVGRARRELTAVGAKIFGVVLNNVDLRREGYDDYYYTNYYHADQRRGDETPARI